MPTAFVIPNQLASAIGTTDIEALGFNPMQKKHLLSHCTHQSAIGTTDITALGFNPMQKKAFVITLHTPKCHRHDRYRSVGFQPNAMIMMR